MHIVLDSDLAASIAALESTAAESATCELWQSEDASNVVTEATVVLSLLLESLMSDVQVAPDV
jgi:hypothetical protein